MSEEHKNTPSDHEIRIRLLEDYKERSLEHHRQIMGKLDTCLKMLAEKECTLHAARGLQVQQDLTKLEAKMEQKLSDLQEKFDNVNVKIAAWTGGLAVVAFIAGKLL